MFNWWTFLFEIINFIVIVYILYRLLFKPVKNIIQKRKKEIDKSREEIEKDRKEVQELKIQYEREQNELKNLRERILEDARVESLREREKILKDVQLKIEEERERNKNLLSHERTRLIEEIKEKSIQTALTLSATLMDSIMDPTINERLINKVFEEIENMNDMEKEELIESSKEGKCNVKIFTAHPLSKVHKEKLYNIIKEKVMCLPSITVHESQDLIGGVKVRINSKVFDGSIEGNLNIFKNQLSKKSVDYYKEEI